MNIDGHLPLPFPFYDAVEKQFFRTESCLRDFRVWNLFTDVRHFPPFEIVAEDVCSGAVSGEVDAYLYDVNDNLVANLETEYDLITQIETKTDGVRTWLVYDASSILNTDLPEGLHYVQIDFCGQTWYSELVNICNDNIGSCDITDIDFYNYVPDGMDTFSWAADEISFTLATPGDGSFYSDRFDIIAGNDYAFSFNLEDSIGNNLAEIVLGTTDTPPAAGDRCSNLISWDIATATGQKTLIFTATQTTSCRIWFYASAPRENIDVTMSGVSFYQYTSCSLADRLELNWWNDCDLAEVLYQTGFRNRLYFPKKISLLSPTYNTEKEIDQVDGVDMISKVVTNKVYTFSFLAPQYMADAMVFMQMHTDIYLTTKTGETIRAQNVNVTPDYYNSCYYRIKIEFVAESVVSSSCCNNYTLMP